jgi:GNAT superfamily N-acetyltransferase
MLEVTIVPATERDLPIILEMIRALAEYEKRPHMVTATEERLRVTLFHSRPAAEVLFANTEAECAGFAVFFPIYSTFAAQAGLYLEDLYVKPHLRGRGIGLALLRHLAGIAMERGCARLEWSVLKWNESSVRFYEKLGAVQVDDWNKYKLAGEPLERLARRDNK